MTQLFKETKMGPKALLRKDKRFRLSGHLRDPATTVSIVGWVPQATPEVTQRYKSALSRVQHITDVKRGRAACEKLSAASVLALDCEGVSLGSASGKLTLVQLFDGRVPYLFDIKKCPALLDHGLRDLLQSKEILKVIHAIQADGDALRSHGVSLGPVFDTQCAFFALNGYRKNFQVGLSSFLECFSLYHPEKANSPHKGNWTSGIRRSPRI